MVRQAITCIHPSARQNKFRRYNRRSHDPRSFEIIEFEKSNYNYYVICIENKMKRAHNENKQKLANVWRQSLTPRIVWEAQVSVVRQWVDSGEACGMWGSERALPVSTNLPLPLPQQTIILFLISWRMCFCNNYYLLIPFHRISGSLSLVNLNGVVPNLKLGINVCALKFSFYQFDLYFYFIGPLEEITKDYIAQL